MDGWMDDDLTTDYLRYHTIENATWKMGTVSFRIRRVGSSRNIIERSDSITNFSPKE